MLDRKREHQRSATAVLRNLARGVGVSLHEGNDSRRGEGRVEHGRARGTQLREVVAHAAATLHELHLLLVHAEYAAVRVGVTAVAYHKAVRERRHLKIVADARHGAALWYDVTEPIQQAEDLLLRHGIGIFVLDAFYLARDASVHILGRAFVNMPERILQRIFAHPHRRGQIVPAEILLRGRHRIIISDLFRGLVGFIGFAHSYFVIHLHSCIIPFSTGFRSRRGREANMRFRYAVSGRRRRLVDVIFDAKVLKKQCEPLDFGA